MQDAGIDAGGGAAGGLRGRGAARRCECCGKWAVSAPVVSSSVESGVMPEGQGAESVVSSGGAESAPNYYDEPWLYYQDLQLPRLPEGDLTPVEEVDFAADTPEQRWIFVPQLFEDWDGVEHDAPLFYSIVFVLNGEMDLGYSGYDAGGAYIVSGFQALGDGMYKATPYKEYADAPAEAVENSEFTFRLESSDEASGTLFFTLLSFEYEGEYGEIGSSLLGGTYPFFAEMVD